ncbi:PLAC8-domain-containing protein [Coprinopsis sp. MPI-PUGE-AT-0042]|nr:PLAC8-domain-containing protein [Coprinopsis sp. MPI-PUGE-AT-0042]
MSYQAQAPMTVQGGNRNSKNVPMTAEGRAWSNSLFSCLEEPVTFIVSCFAPCVVYGRVKHRYEYLEAKGMADPTEGGELITNDTIMHGAANCCALGFIFQMGNRQNIRTRYNVQGDSVMDLLTSCCCAPCALTQESREIELEEESLGHKRVSKF